MGKLRTSLWLSALLLAGSASCLDAAPIESDDDSAALSVLQSRFESIAKRAAPSVVAISAAVTSVDTDDALRSDDLTGQKLDGILDHVTRTVGTGFVIDAGGYILTNEHVISQSTQIWVTTDDKRVFPAMVVGSDPRADLAVLKIPADKLSPVTFAAPDSVARGQWTMTLGNPYGLAGFGEMSLSVGVVSATERNLTRLSSRENRLYSNLIQTTAQINPGNSGGPLFDLQGRVIGINTAVVMPQKQTNGIGFALPVTQELLQKVCRLKDGQEIVYAYMGVTVTNPTPRQRRDAGIASEIGVKVESVDSGSPASEPIKAGDLLISIERRVVRDSDQFVRLIGDCPIDRPVAMEIVRDRKPMKITLALVRRELPAVAITRAGQRFRWRGLLLGPVPENWGRRAEKAAGGVMVIGLEPDCEFARQGVACGSVVTAIGGRAIDGLISFQRAINDTPADQCALTFDKLDEQGIARSDP